MGIVKLAIGEKSVFVSWFNVGRKKKKKEIDKKEALKGDSLKDQEGVGMITFRSYRSWL
jgi:hypothetical protein